MESVQNIKRRLKSVENIGQITKAMELVAATRMRRSQEIALASRPYAFAAFELLANLEQALSSKQFKTTPLLEKRVVKKTAIVVVTSDKGLAGSFNASVLRAFEKFVKREGIDAASDEYPLIAVGQKAAQYLERRFGKLEEKFIRFGDYTTIEEVRPLSDALTQGFLSERWDKVTIFSMHFRSALRQEVIERQLFPIDFETIKHTAQELVPERGRFAELMKETGMEFFGAKKSLKEDEYLIEPFPTVVLNQLIPELITMEIYDLVLEANASEHAARRAAMKNASDNASDLAEGLGVQYNKSRQAQITKELTEITSGAEALK